MKNIWSIIGIIVLIIILYFVINKIQASNQASKTTMMPIMNQIPKDTTSTTQRQVQQPVQPVIQPIINPTPIVVINSGVDCSSAAYQNNLQSLYDTYLQKRALYNTAISTNDPNVIQIHQDLNDAYNAWGQEAMKCNLLK